MKILHIDASILGEQSVSKRIASNFIEKLNSRLDEVNQITYRDVVKNPINHLTGDIASGFRNLGMEVSDENILQEHRISEELVNEFLMNDLIVISVPMYNFSIPTQLKAWFDRIAQVGKTFKYTENGPVGLSEGRKVIVVSSRGGFYLNQPLIEMDFQERYVNAFFKFLGINEISFIRVEGTSKGNGVKDLEVEKAIQSIDHVIDGFGIE